MKYGYVRRAPLYLAKASVCMKPESAAGPSPSSPYLGEGGTFIQTTRFSRVCWRSQVRSRAVRRRTQRSESPARREDQPRPCTLGRGSALFPRRPGESQFRPAASPGLKVRPAQVCPSFSSRLCHLHFWLTAHSEFPWPSKLR